MGSPKIPKKGPGSGRKGQKSSSWSFWAIGALAVLVAAWTSLRQDASKSKLSEAEWGEDSHDSPNYAGSIREVFFSEDGRYNFAKNGDGAKKKVGGFSTADYWEKRYSEETREHYDWYGTWNSPSKIRIKPHVLAWMPEKVGSVQVLNVGCGNSRLSEELANDGYTDIVSVDIAQSAIDRMTEKFKGKSALRFLQMDATNMTFEDDSFDVIFDKGTFDAMYIGAGHLVKLAVAQIYRVMRPGGVFVSLSFGHPTSRRDLNFTSGVEDRGPSGWERFETKKIHLEDDDSPDKQTFWMYLMTKPLEPVR